jgi:hypothetical protein
MWSIIITNDWVPSGTPLQLNGGEIPSPSQVNSTGNVPLSENAGLVSSIDGLALTAVALSNVKDKMAPIMWVFMA